MSEDFGFEVNDESLVFFTHLRDLRDWNPMCFMLSLLGCFRSLFTPCNFPYLLWMLIVATAYLKVP